MLYITVKQLAQAVNNCQRLSVNDLFQINQEAGKQAGNRPEKTDTETETGESENV